MTRPATTPPAAATDPSAVSEPEAIATIGPEDLMVTVQAGRHEFRSDAVPESGGRDEAPNPFRLLLGSLGACTAMTIRLYADRKGWPLEGVRVSLSHDRRRAEAGEAGATDAGWVFTVDKRIELLGDLDEGQRTRLLAMGEKCPVNQALMSQVRITHGESGVGGADVPLA